jgi:DNA-binding transcriptional regulator YhcF (GntR family)
MTLTSASIALPPSAQAPAVALKRTSTSHQLYELLRDRIISLELLPGLQLSRNDLAATYGVSQTPVRDALQMLEKEGLVTVYPQSRTEVTRIDVRLARETQFLRMSLELEVVRALSTEAGQAAVSLAERILQLQETALNIDRDLERFVGADPVALWPYRPAAKTEPHGSGKGCHHPGGAQGNSVAHEGLRSSRRPRRRAASPIGHAGESGRDPKEP